MANTIYNKFYQGLGDGEFDFGVDTIKIALVTSAYTPDFTDTGDEFESDLGAAVLDELALSSLTWVDRVLDAADIVIVFPDSNGGTGIALVLYKDTGTPSTSRLIAYFDTLSGLPYTQDGNDDSITFDASGILRLGA